MKGGPIATRDTACALALVDYWLNGTSSVWISVLISLSLSVEDITVGSIARMASWTRYG
jgi:hypothetical protein